ncbi:MAG: FMN-binding protein [Ferrimicrobium sp.]|uniref:FMN-binding protein n=2 Tax=Ferrimicrobium TaxID=121038 RepID=A0ABV3Y327_9ACTN|nr:FMN-binding protein [Ferrimicrobium sp.]
MIRRAFTVLGAMVVGLLGILTLYPRAKSQLSAASVNKNHGGSKSSSQKAAAASAPLPVGPVSVTGPLTNYGFGDIAVKVDVANHKIVDISIAKFQALEAYSIEIEQAAVPSLRAEALKAQGLPIGIVTGATYTSQGFAYSLQGALNKLKGK